MLNKKSFRERDNLSGGLSDQKSIKDFDQDALAKGTKVELEHTDDKELAEEITGDHLTEDKDYYEKLEKIESSLKALELILKSHGLMSHAKAVIDLSRTIKPKGN